MLEELSRKTVDGILNGMEVGRKTLGRLRLRRSLTSRGLSMLQDAPRIVTRGGPRGGTWILVSLGAFAALGLAALLYLRKRRQVAAHYNMGDSGDGSAPVNGYADELGRRAQPA